MCLLRTHSSYVSMCIIWQLWSTFQHTSFAVLILWNKCPKSENSWHLGQFSFEKYEITLKCLWPILNRLPPLPLRLVIDNRRSIDLACVLLRMPINVFDSILHDCSAMLI